MTEFASPAEEIAFWKEKYEDLELSFSEHKEEREQAEEELENDLLTAEEKALDFELKYEQERQEKEDLVLKSRDKHDESMRTITRMQEELDHYRELSDRLANDRQRLEQANDDLERREREMSATIHDLRDKVDFGTEKGVIVSLELEELRVSTQEIIQRLKDENRDQKQELNVRAMEIDALQRQLPRFEGRAASKMLTPNLSPLGFVDDMLVLVKDIEASLIQACQEGLTV